VENEVPMRICPLVGLVSRAAHSKENKYARVRHLLQQLHLAVNQQLRILLAFCHVGTDRNPKREKKKENKEGREKEGCCPDRVTFSRREMNLLFSFLLIFFFLLKEQQLERANAPLSPVSGSYFGAPPPLFPLRCSFIFIHRSHLLFNRKQTSRLKEKKKKN
jgi:hypothetical protein